MVTQTRETVQIDRLVPRAADGSATERLVLSGDDTGASEVLVYLDDRQLARFSGWRALERTLTEAGRLEIDPAGCQFFLAYGLVPPPYTLYANVYALGVGDRLEIDLGRDDASFRVDFPYFDRRSRQDGTFDPVRFRRLLAGAVSRSVPGGTQAAFMQSSGKDSTGLLVGLREAGRTDVRAVTYDASYREEEGAIAAELASRFGLEHQIVRADPEAECRAFLTFAERSPSICADLTLPAYVHSLEQAGVGDGVVLDGLGNDAYMGYVQPRTDAWLCAASIPRLWPAAWGRFEVPDLGARASYVLKSMLMYPAERSLAGSRLSPRTVTDLIPVATPFTGYFAEMDRKLRGLSPTDFRANVRGRIFDGCETMPKGRLAAAHHGARAVFPYCDEELIDYCFHLPRADRYDSRIRRNKLALRRLLEQEVGESHYLSHKGSFRFDVLRFVEVNQAAIRRELDAARPLFENSERWVESLFRRRSNYVHAYMLTTWFMLSAWLVRRPAKVTAPLANRSPHRQSATLREEGSDILEAEGVVEAGVAKRDQGAPSH
jgi:asparagine synthase (glutamine-hydrolysing)